MDTKVLKVMSHEFKGSDNEIVKGQYIYLLITRSSGSEETRRVFVSDDRLAEWGHIPKAGDLVHVFAKDGKVVDMLKVETKAKTGGAASGSEEPVPF